MSTKENGISKAINNGNYWYFLSAWLFLTLVAIKLFLNTHFTMTSLAFPLYFLTNFSGSLVLSFPFLLVGKTPSRLYFLALFILTLFNHEHIIINNGHLNFGLWHLGASEVFLNSLFHYNLAINILYLSTLLSLACLAAHLLLSKYKIKLNKALIIEVTLILFTIDYLIPKDISLPEWQQSSLISSTLKKLTTPRVKTIRQKSDNQGHRLTLSMDRVKNKPDIYLFILEGFSQDYLDRGLAPELKKLQKKALSIPQFIANQQQTNRGLYSLFCGDLPNLLNIEAKADILISSQNRKPVNCLPHALKSIGYTSYFIQSAPLSFMAKDQFSKSIGFDYALGAEDYFTNLIIGPWGVDDQTTMETVLTTAKEKDSPKLVSALTISTHYPYKTKKSNGSLVKAIKYTDSVTSLAIKHILENYKNSIVVVTSDESRPLRPELPLILANRGLFMALGDSINPMELGRPFSLVDVPLIIKNLLLNKGNELEGLPIKPIYFGNIYTSRLYKYSPDKNSLMTCNRHLNCVYHEGIKNIFSQHQGSFKRAQKSDINNIRDFLRQNEWSFSKTVYLKENFKIQEGKTFNVFQEFKIQPEGDSIELKVKPTKPLTITYTAYECGKPQTQRVKKIKVQGDEANIKLFFTSKNTQCLSLYLKSISSQEIPYLKISFTNDYQKDK